MQNLVAKNQQMQVSVQNYIINQVYLLHISVTHVAILGELHSNAIFSNVPKWPKHVGEIQCFRKVAVHLCIYMYRSLSTQRLSERTVLCS
jgi:hypothetical protein